MIQSGQSREGPPPFPPVWWPDPCCWARFSDTFPHGVGGLGEHGVGGLGEHGLGSGLMFHMDTEMLVSYCFWGPADHEGQIRTTVV